MIVDLNLIGKRVLVVGGGNESSRKVEALLSQQCEIFVVAEKAEQSIKHHADDGKIISIDNSDEFSSLANKFWKQADIQHKIESVIGQGVEVMQSYVDRQFSFDLIFIDADKNNYPHYYELSLELLPSNGIIIIDNMLWGGDVVDLSIKDTQTETIRSLNAKIQKDERVHFSLLPISDGLSFIRKK